MVTFAGRRADGEMRPVRKLERLDARRGTIRSAATLGQTVELRCKVEVVLVHNSPRAAEGCSPR